MGKWVTLTLVESGNAVEVDCDEIAVMQRNEENGTKLNLRASPDAIVVSEPPTLIKEMAHQETP